jgi:anaerobic dimethyl sulfoxide reductase subunit B
MNKRYGFSFEAERCLKCWSCEVACKQWHGIKAGTVKLRRVVEVTSGTFPDVKRTFLSLSCRHCAKAPCAAACPTHAISQRIEDGIVVVDSQKCIGCRTCLDACPFGVPQYAEDGTMQKCDMCLDRLALGQKPICAETCPSQALHWGTLKELSQIATMKAANKLVSDSRLK